jgi:hypothetical protein
VGFDQGARGVIEQRGSPALIPARFCDFEFLSLKFGTAVEADGLSLSLCILVGFLHAEPIKRQGAYFILLSFLLSFLLFCSYHSYFQC